MLARVLGRPVELIEQRGARRARPLGERQQRRFAVAGPRRLVAGVAREHEAVDHERVLAGLEQLRQPHVGRRPVRSLALKDVVRLAPARPAGARA